MRKSLKRDRERGGDRREREHKGIKRYRIRETERMKSRARGSEETTLQKDKRERHAERRVFSTEEKLSGLSCIAAITS